MALVAVIGLVATLAPVSSGAVQNVVVSPTPLNNTPRILDGRVYTIAESGGRIFVGGTFTSVKTASETPVTRNRIMSYSKATGRYDAWAPDFNGDVDSIVPSPDGAWLYVGGAFTTINGAPVKYLAKISATDPNVIDPTFATRPNNIVVDMALVGSHLVIGGRFHKVGSATRDLLASVDTTTGAAQSWLTVGLSEARAINPFLQELDVSADGHWLVVGGNFKKVGGLDRNQIAVLDLTGPTVTVADWQTDRFVGTCSNSSRETYIRGVDISPDSSYFVVGTTGAYGGNNTTCDTVTRWELPPALHGTGLQPTWIDYTGGDTHWAIEVTESAVYAGGHQRWENNPDPTPGGDNDGPGAVSRPGISALDPTTGVPLSWNPGRDRGRGVEAFLAASDYLYVGSDTNNFAGALHQRLAVLPVAGGTPNPLPQQVGLPVTIHQARADGTMVAMSFDGQTVGAPTTISGPGVDAENWASQRGAFEQYGQLVYFGGAGAYYRRSFDGTTLGAPTTLSTSVGYVDHDANNTPYDQPYHVDSTRAAAYFGGRIFYTRDGDSRLWWRWYSDQSGIIGAQEFVASPADFSTVTGLEVAGGWLYASYANNTLMRMPIDATGHADYLHRVLVDDGAVTGHQWATRDFSFAPAAGTGFEPAQPTPLVCSGASPIRARYFVGMNPTGFPLAERCESSGQHPFGSASPDPAIPSDNFSAHWDQTVSLATPHYVKFSIDSDDGARLYLDGDKILDAWQVQSTTHYETTLAVGPGDHTFGIDYFEQTGNATANFSVDVLGEIAVPPKAAVVVPDPGTVQSGDARVATALAAGGYDVTYVDDTTFDATQAAPYAVVWIGGNTDSNALLARLKDIPVPVVDQKSKLLTSMLMGTKTSTAVSSTLNIVNPGHPLAAGRSGTVSILTAAKALSTATPAAAAVRIADPAVGAYFTLPTGAARTDGSPAPACRVSFPVEYNALASLTSDGAALLDATVAYLSGPDC